MRTTPRILSLAIFVLMIAPLATVSAEVSWQHQLTDGIDDVRNLITQENATDMSGLDILAGSIAEQGDDLNVTIALAGAYDSQAAYTLEVECDGDDGRIYSFTYLNDRFAIEGPDLSDAEPETYISADGELLSWVVPKDDISASERTEVSYVETFRLDGLTPFSDTLPDGGGGSGGGGGPTGDARTIQVLAEIIKVDHVRTTVRTGVDGTEAASLRSEFDSDGDSTVTRAEYDQHIGLFHLTLATWNHTDMTLDGKEADHTVMSVSFDGLIGDIASSSPVSQVITLDIYFPGPADSTVHSYSNDLVNPGTAGDMWHVTEASSFTITLPQGWTFDTSGWPEGLDAHLEPDGRSLSMSGTEMHDNWNATLGDLSTISIVEGGDGGGGDGESPGYGALAAGVAIIVGMAALSLRKR